MQQKFGSLTRRTLVSSAAALPFLGSAARAQNPAEVKVGLIVPLSGLYARPASVMRICLLYTSDAADE